MRFDENCLSAKSVKRHTGATVRKLIHHFECDTMLLLSKSSRTSTKALKPFCPLCLFEFKLLRNHLVFSLNPLRYGRPPRKFFASQISSDYARVKEEEVMQ